MKIEDIIVTVICLVLSAPVTYWKTLRMAQKIGRGAKRIEQIAQKMSDSEEAKAGASSALLNIASAYSDSDSSQDNVEEYKPQESLGSLVENLRAEAKKSENMVQARITAPSISQWEDQDRVHSVTKIVRLDSGKVVKISTSSGAKIPETRTEETKTVWPTSHTMTDKVRPVEVGTGSQVVSQQIAHTETVSNNSRTKIDIDHKLEPPSEKESQSSEVADDTISTGTEFMLEKCNIEVSSDVVPDPVVVVNKENILDVKVESRNLQSLQYAEKHEEEMRGSKDFKEADTLQDGQIQGVKSHGLSQVNACDKGISLKTEEGSDLAGKNVIPRYLESDAVVVGECNVNGSLGAVQKSVLIESLTPSEQSSKLGSKTESNILNAYLTSKQGIESAVVIQRSNEKLNRDIVTDPKTHGTNACEESGFQGSERSNVEKLNTAGSVIGFDTHLQLEKDTMDVKIEKISASMSSEETLLPKSEMYDIKPRPELRSQPAVERVKSKSTGIESLTKKTDSELKTSSPTMYKLLESCDSYQSTITNVPATPEVKKSAPGPIKLKRNFSCISTAVSEQIEKKVRTETTDAIRPVASEVPVPPATSAKPSEEVAPRSQQQEPVKSPITVNISSPSQSLLSSTFEQLSPPQQCPFSVVNSTPNQVPASQPLKKSPQPAPSPPTQRITRREEQRRTLPLILRKADISSGKSKEPSKIQESRAKAFSKKEESSDAASKVTSETEMSMETISSESQEQSVSLAFSNSSSNPENSNFGASVDFDNMIGSSASNKDVKVTPLLEDSGSDNARPPPTKDEAPKHPISFLNQSLPPMEMPTIIIPKKRGRPRKFPLPEPATYVGTWPMMGDTTPKSTKPGKRKKMPRKKGDGNAAEDDDASKKRYVSRFKRKKGSDGEESEGPRGSFNKKGRMEVITEGCKPVTVNQITEYFWPPVSSLQPGEKPEGLMIQEQISEYLGVKSFKRKYPSIKRRPVDMEERNYLQENGYVSENMCDMGLTAVYSADIMEIMYNDFPHKFDEYRRYAREKKIREQKALREKQAAENMDPRKEAVESALSWNTEFNKTRRPKRSYNYQVLLDGWYERKFDEEYKLAMYLKKKERGQLLLSKVRRLFTNLLKDVQLSLPTRGLAYGGIIQLMAPDVVGHPPLDRRSSNKGLVLAVTLESEDVDYKQDFEDNLLIVGSPVLRPCLRNSFYIDPEDKRKIGQPLCFGDVFYLRCAAETEVPLYVSVPVFSPFGVVGRSGFPIPRLTVHRGFDARFRVLHLVKDLRHETHGLSVSPFEKVLVVHAPVDVPLCVENGFWENSLFSPECEISVHATMNLKKEYEVTNQWMFTVGTLK